MRFVLQDMSRWMFSTKSALSFKQSFLIFKTFLILDLNIKKKKPQPKLYSVNLEPKISVRWNNFIIWNKKVRFSDVERMPKILMIGHQIFLVEPEHNIVFHF